MRFDLMSWPSWAIGPLAIVVVSALPVAVFAIENSRDEKRLECRAADFFKKEKRYVSVFMTEDTQKRWYLPAIISVCKSQDKTKEYRRIDTVYWLDGAHIDFEECILHENLIGDCTDDQGRHWRAKVYAKITDEIPKEYNYPESCIPSIRALFRE